MTSPLRKIFLYSAALMALATAVFLPGLSGGFILDDYPNIVSNPRIHIDSIDWESIKTAARAYEPGPYGRPLATISFALDYFVGGNDAANYKQTNLGLHLVNALLIFALLRLLLALPRAWGQRERAMLPAFIISLLWAVHPIQVSSVLYVVQRMEMLSTTFILLGLLAYVRGRLAQQDGRLGWQWLLGSVVLAAIGMLSKESAVLFPAYTLALELTLLGFEAKSPRTQRWLKIAYATGTVFAVVMFAAWLLPKYSAPGMFDSRGFSLGERMLSQLRILPMYIGQMVLPLPSTLTFYYDTYPKSLGLLNPATTLAGGLFLAALLFAAWRLRHRSPLISLGILWFFSAHLLTSNVFNLELVFEHRNYFALLGTLLALAAAIHLIPMRDGPALKRVAVGAVIVGFGFLAIMRAATWGNPLTLAMDHAAKNPTSPRASNDLATIYVGMSDGNADSPFFSLGKKEFERGSQLDDASPLPEQGLILMAASARTPANPEWWDRLIDKTRKNPIGPQEHNIVINLLSQRLHGLELDDQKLPELIEAILDRRPMPAYFYAMYGDYALTVLHDEALSDRMFVAAIERNPTDKDYAGRIFATLTADGRARQAQAVLARAQALNLLEAGAWISKDQSPVQAAPHR